MNRKFKRFLIYFILFFSLNLGVNLLFKSSLELLTAFSVALGFSAGMALVYKEDN
ncbi:hypothetical protein ACNRWW_06910 [Metabacillus sp. HB246100]|uniref:hypothetical protein n=1 Tax=Bacillus weihaiensis TaxID=1547283 RepID=UPI00235244C8|nr:hypothetical protein [Bacillus weihaiensis]